MISDADIISMIVNYGVAGFIAVYLVLFITKRLNGKLDKLIDRLDRLIIILERVNYHVDPHDKIQDNIEND